MNLVFLLFSIVAMIFLCDTRRKPLLASVATGLAFVVIFPLQGQFAYFQHVAVEASILTVAITTRAPIYYKILISIALFSHAIMIISWHTNLFFYTLNPIYKLILPAIYTLFLILTTKAENALFSWWPPKRHRTWQAKEAHAAEHKP